MDLSIIIISYNTKKLLFSCLTSLYSTLKQEQISYEVIVVDNASTDGSREMISQEFPKTIIISNTKNIGFGSANNQGIKRSKGMYILLLNSDTVVRDHAIRKLLQFVSTHPKAFVGPRLLNADRSVQASCGPFFTPPVVFAILFLRGDIWGLTRYKPERVMKVGWVSGACILAKKSSFADGLLFDEKIFMYMEEIDLLYRAKKKGYTTYVYPSSEVVHYGSGSTDDKKKAAIMNIYKGFLYFYQKHYTVFDVFVIRVFLKIKAIFGIILGTILGNSRTKDIYEEAYRVV